jgi:hypothetical protein
MQLYLSAFKSAAAEGAVAELKLRLVAGKVPGLREQALEQNLQNIEDGLAEHFSGVLSAEDKETLRLCRQLRNKVLHADFHAARGKLNELGIATPSGEVRSVKVQVLTRDAVIDQIQRAIAGTEGVLVADTTARESGVFGWFVEAGVAGDFQKASDAFIRASDILDRLAAIDDPDAPNK